MYGGREMVINKGLAKGKRKIKIKGKIRTSLIKDRKSLFLKFRIMILSRFFIINNKKINLLYWVDRVVY